MLVIDILGQLQIYVFAYLQSKCKYASSKYIKAVTDTDFHFIAYKNCNLRTTEIFLFNIFLSAFSVAKIKIWK